MQRVAQPARGWSAGGHAPARGFAASPSALEYSYDKILAEQALVSRGELPATILRLPKVYGARDNANLATI